MNEENIKRIESNLARAYKEGHYKESLDKMLNEKPTIMQNIFYAIENFFH